MVMFASVKVRMRTSFLRFSISTLIFCFTFPVRAELFFCGFRGDKIFVVTIEADCLSGFQYGALDSAAA